MSDLSAKAQLSDSKDCPPCSAKPVNQKMLLRQAHLGEQLTIRRALPHRERRMIGAWCFLDYFGPLHLQNGHELNVAPHPHIGLQTFTWILEGEILHRDSLGSIQVIKPGQINLMTAGKGVAHSEESINPGSTLQGLQLWIALPDALRNMEPEFIHYSQLPVLHHAGLAIHVMVGDLFDVKAPTAVHSPLIGLDILAVEYAAVALPLNPKFEYGILPLTGGIKVEGDSLDENTLLYLGRGRNELVLDIPKNKRFLLIGGEPFSEEVLIWWNFVARTKEEIKSATDAWNSHTHFGDVQGYVGERTLAPIMP